MATTEAGTTLTEAHRVAQVGIQAEAVADLAALWPLLDPADLDRSFPGYARAALAVLDLRREQSATLATGYYSSFREIEGATDAFTVPALAALAEEEALAALYVTGPMEAKKTLARSRAAIIDRGTRLDVDAEPLPLSTRVNAAMERALTSTAGTFMAITASGGRDVVSASIERDPVCLGYARVTDGSPCSFCAMLASRGPVYKSAASAAGRDYHAHCGCTAEPIIGEGFYKAPGRADEFAALWEETGAHYSGNDAVNAFRRAYERPHLHLP